MYRPFPDCRASEVLGRARSFRAFERVVEAARSAEAVRHVLEEQRDAADAIHGIEREEHDLTSTISHVESEACGREVVLARARKDVQTGTERERRLVEETSEREAEVKQLSDAREVLVAQMKEKVAEGEELLVAAEPLQKIKKTRTAQAKDAKSR